MLVTYAVDVGWKHHPVPYIYEHRETEDVEATRMEIWQEYRDKGYEWNGVEVVDVKGE